MLFVNRFSWYIIGTDVIGFVRVVTTEAKRFTLCLVVLMKVATRD